jgi:sugar lactone lactonase YvrE
MPNGMVSSLDKRGVIFAESAVRKIYSIPDDAHNLDLNSLGLYLDTSNWIPDGLARDHLGLLWVARWGEGLVTRIATVSLPQLDVHVPTLQTTAIAFDPLGTMYITTGREHFDAEQRLADPLAGSIFTASIYGTSD